MKKTILAIAMLFSIVINSQNKGITGIWNDSVTGDYYTVILSNEEEGFKFLNFSFGEQDTVNEFFLDLDNDTIKTIVNNPDNNWKVYCEYILVDNNTLQVTYSGNYEGTHYMERKYIYNIE